jgi:hypothetical protein
MVAGWFGTTRNPLSGRNNRNDDNTLRLGDIIYQPALVEVKRRGTVNISTALEVMALAMANFKPWVLIEFKTGWKNVVKLTVDAATAQYLCECLDKKWREENKR